MTTTRHSAWLEAAVHIAAAAGQCILDVYNRPFSVEHKEDNSPLTLADRCAHELIVARLNALTPEIPVLSEESAKLDYSARAAWQRFWLVDPLDGTREFIKRNGEFTVNIALIENQQPVLGVVQVPVTGIVYIGLRGSGAWKQQQGKRQPIRVRPYQGGRATVVASRSHRGEAVDQFLVRLAAREGSYETASLGSSLKLCLIAEGAADIYPRLGPTSEWDTAAAQCVVEAAGGRVLDLQGEALRYNKTDILNPWFLVSGAGDYDWRALLV
ncbi:MAG: 3'(2'),5'-bisphosphate nucleotidase CysQ [Gammaproteobacteria bacterium]|nr:3'(2'),5'-bisphosphate nucleotidase CysQ [Gammaproteobacteria bacterium]